MEKKTVMNELELIKSAKAGDERALARIIRQYEPLIHKAARKYGFMAAKHQYDDLVQEGRLGVFKAVQKFQPERGYKFMTLAFPCVRGAVQGYARKENKHPKFTTSYESIKRSNKLEDPTVEFEVRMDVPEGKTEEVFLKICGSLDSKRAQVLCDKFGLFGREELRSCEIAEKYGLTKQAVNSYVVKFRNRVRKLYPELEAYV
jgi:RNA polymerase sporulation-specific sigma factor